MKFPSLIQYDIMDCGPTCLRMVAKFYGKNYSLQALRELTETTREGVSLKKLAEASEAIGLQGICVRLPDKELLKVPLPSILHWGENHFVVLYKINSNKDPLLCQYHIADPAEGVKVLTHDEFMKMWAIDYLQTPHQGIALLLQTTPNFYKPQEDANNNSQNNKTTIKFGQLWDYVSAQKQLIWQLFLGLLVTSILQLLLPFITQSVVDVGISQNNLKFIYVALAAQFALFMGRTSIEFIRSWLLLHISTRLNLSILSLFFAKLTKLPASFFEVKMFGDLLQRINDHERIENFLTSSTLGTLFSIFNLLVFSIVIGVFYWPILLVFGIGSLLYVGWVLLFMQRRRKLDFKLFELSAANQSKMIQMIEGMHEIKLANAETEKRWEWEGVQAKLYNVNVKALSLSQYQQAGALFLNESKNILITFLSAYAVIDGKMTLGAMLSIQYMIGQLNGPIEHLIQFLQSYQDAKISLERLNEIHELKNEENVDGGLVSQIPSLHSLQLKKVTYHYAGAGDMPVLKDIDLYIPAGKTTAIVGASGSGKTTLLKLLLKFYEPQYGQIMAGNLPLSSLSHRSWRNACGVVMQDGYIFSDTILRNIAVGVGRIDKERVVQAAKIANIDTFVDTLALGYNTRIGVEGIGLSQGQKQRILIARAIYKDPIYIFLDEATNALDATNEKEIQRNLNQVFDGKTVIVVAHRLSTVKDADQIVVLEKGQIIENGTHEYLLTQKGKYYQLVANQLQEV